MGAVLEHKTTAAEYLEFERGAEEKHEFFGGLIYAMAGGTISHSQIAANLIAKLGAALEGAPCRALGSDMRVGADGESTYFYPDASGFCGPALFADNRKDTLLNPVFIAEVLSESTEAFDRGDKFFAYQAIGSFQEYLLVSQWEMKAELFQRQPDGRWLLTTFVNGGDRVELQSVECTIRLGDLYDKVEFEPRLGKERA